MTKYSRILAMLFIVCSLGWGGPKTELGLNMGVVWPNNDALTQQTFGKGFYIVGMLGLIDESGWEIRGNLGKYSSLSHYSTDEIAMNRRINVHPLTASLIYTMPGAFVRPYIGGGVGGYFYDVGDDLYGTLENGFRLGFLVMGGIKVNVSDTFCLNAEYVQSFLPPSTFFDAAHNFDLAALTMGAIFMLSPGDAPQNSRATKPYKYTREQEELLIQIQQAQTEWADMKKKRTKLESEIDAFYETNDYDESSKEFARDLRKVKYQESKLRDLVLQISNAEKDIKDLKQQWDRLQVDAEPVENHVVYLERNYAYSPWGLRTYQGNITRRGVSPHPRYYRAADATAPIIVINTPPPPSTIEEKKAFLEKKKQVLEDMKHRTLQR